MKYIVLLLIFSTLGIFAKDVSKIHDWVQTNIQSLEKYIQETDMTSDILLGVQRNDKGKNFQNWIFSTNHKQHIELTDGQLQKTTAFGPESEYFTEATQNLVFLGTQIKDKEWIKIQMKKSNEDTQRIDMFAQNNYQGVSLINSNNEGTMNRLLIVENMNEIISSYEENGKSTIQISNLSEGQSLFYILYSQNSEVSDIEKLFNYIVKNVIDLEKEHDLNADEQPVTQDDGEEESDPNDIEKLKKPKKQGDGEENDGEGEEKDKEGQEKKQQEQDQEHQEVPEEDCPGGEEDDTVKNKVDVDTTTQLPPQDDPKNVKIQTTGVTSEEKVEVVEESKEKDEVIEESEEEDEEVNAPPKKNQAQDEKDEPEPPSEDYQNCAGEELDTVKNKRDLNQNLESKQSRVFQANEVTIKDTIHEEEGEGDGQTGGQGNTQGEEKGDDTEGKTEKTEGETEGTEGKTEGTEGKTDDTTGTEGKTDDTTGTEGKTDDTTGTEGKTDDTTGTEGKTDDTTGTQEKTDEPEVTEEKTDDTKGTEGKTDEPEVTEEKTDNTKGTEGTTDESEVTEGKTDDTKGTEETTDEPEVTEGKTDDTKGTEETTDEPQVTEEKTDDTKGTDGKTDDSKGTEGTTDETEGNTDDESKTKPEKENQKQEPEEPCVILYSECHFTGDELKLCGAQPVIPNDMKNFKVKSIKVPEGVQVTFFNKPNFDDEKLHAKNEMECLETPLRLNLLELMNNLRMSKQININSISVTN